MMGQYSEAGILTVYCKNVVIPAEAEVHFHRDSIAPGEVLGGGCGAGMVNDYWRLRIANCRTAGIRRAE